MIQNLMTGGASIEDTLALWAASLRETKRRIRPLFSQDRVAKSAGQFLDPLLGNEPRKTGWMRAEAAGDGGPWQQQALLGRGRWDADALRDIVCDYVIAQRRIPASFIIAWSTFRRAHQADTRRSHLKSKMQL